MFITEFLRRKRITLIVQQVLHKENIFIPPGLQKDQFVFSIYISVVPQNEFVSQWITLESNQGVLDTRGGFFCPVSQHCSCSLEEKGFHHVY